MVAASKLGIGIPLPNFDVKNDEKDEKDTSDSKEQKETENIQEKPSIILSENAPQETQITMTSAKSFDIDVNINKALYYLVVFIVYVMIGLSVIAVAAVTLYNYAIFCYYTIYEFLQASDEYNAEKLFIRDTYSFRLLNYIFCQGKDVEDLKGCDSKGIGYYIEYFFNLLIPLDKCDAESKVYIYGLNKAFNFCMKLFYLIIVIICIQLLAYIIIHTFLGGLRNYEIKGKTLISYLSTYGMLYVYIIMLIFVYCLVHSIHFKFTFVDNVYDRIFKKYEVFRELDLYVNGEAKSIEAEKGFITILTSSTIHNLSKDGVSDTYNHKDKILAQISDDDTYEVQSSKYFLYALYKYVVQHNNNSDIEVVVKLNKVVLQQTEEAEDSNTKSFVKHTMREFLKLNLDMDIVKKDLNDIMIGIGDEKQKKEEGKSSKSTIVNIFDKYDFEKPQDTKDTFFDLKTKLATKLSKFLSLLEASANQNFDDVIYYMNMYIVLEWFINAVFILILLTITYYNADQSPWVKRLVIAAQALIISIIEEIQMGLIGI
jgi:hypothetical protein